MEIDCINGMKTNELGGMAKYREEINNRLTSIKINNIEYSGVPIIPGANRLMECFIYPLIVKKKVQKTHVKHITRQDLAYLNKNNDLGSTVVTCLDIIPLVYYNININRTLVWRGNITGLSNATKIITISEFSKQDIIKHLGIPEGDISVVSPAVDQKLYYPMRNREILKKYGIKDDEKVVLYVGAEEPRKNLSLLLDAFSQLKREIPGLKLIKVGNPNCYGARDKLIRHIKALDLQKDIILTDYVPEFELPLFYNAADLFVYPSLYEGFGLPPLEAMACGTPVVTSDATSLPEVVGDAALTIDPHDLDGLTDKMHALLTDQPLRETMVTKGLARAKIFTWEEAARRTYKVYESVSPE